LAFNDRFSVHERAFLSPAFLFAFSGVSPRLCVVALLRTYEFCNPSRAIRHDLFARLQLTDPIASLAILSDFFICLP
jgi:hypothetical protein